MHTIRKGKGSSELGKDTKRVVPDGDIGAKGIDTALRFLLWSGPGPLHSATAASQAPGTTTMVWPWPQKQVKDDDTRQPSESLASAP